MRMAKSKKRPKQIHGFLILAVIVLILAGLWYFQGERPPEEKPPEVPEEPGVQDRELVAINYVLALPNGTVVDTNNETLAKKWGITNYVKGPFRFIVGQSGKVKGFDEAIIGMQLDTERKKIIPPSENVLKYTQNLTRQVSRNQNFPRYVPIRLKRFKEQFGREPVINDVIVHPSMPWPIKVINMTERNVGVEALAEEGKMYTIPGSEWKSLLLVKRSRDLFFRHNPEEGQIITTEYGKARVSLEVGRLNLTYLVEKDDIITYRAGIKGLTELIQEFQIIEITDKDFTFRRINYLPQETLVLIAELVEWEPDINKKKKSKAKEA